MFVKAQKKKSKARIGLVGPAGSGKTYSALLLAFGLAPGGKIAVIDTEHGSADLYADLGDYDVAPISAPFSPQKYLQLIGEAEKAEYDVIIIDSLSHLWAAEGGLLDMKDKIASSSRSGNSYTAWKEVTPWHDKLIQAMLQSPAHIIATMRSKTEYVLEENDKGKKMPKKIGMAPVQREGMDYEFTIVFDVDQKKHYATVSKNRISLFDQFCGVIKKDHGKQILDWLNDGIDPSIAAAERVAIEEAKIKNKADSNIRALAKHLTLTDEELKNALHLFATKGRALQSADDLTIDELRAFYADLKAEDSYIVADALKNREGG